MRCQEIDLTNVSSYWNIYCFAKYSEFWHVRHCCKNSPGKYSLDLFMIFHLIVKCTVKCSPIRAALTEITFHRMRIDVNFCFAIDLVTACVADHEYPKQRLQNNCHSICLINNCCHHLFLTVVKKHFCSMYFWIETLSKTVRELFVEDRLIAASREKDTWFYVWLGMPQPASWHGMRKDHDAC